MNVTKTRIMGILNVTPDSFYDGGRYLTPEIALKRAIEMVKEGADIIDVGGESTRPGAEPVSIQEEMDRVCPVIELITGETDVPISVDTTKSAVALEALKCGAAIVNDISGLTFDRAIVDAVAQFSASLVVMHIRGKPVNMQKNTGYNDLLQDILDFLMESVTIALKGGVEKERIILDPGIGFGKSLEQNYIILNNINKFTETGYPVLIGLSRKSLISRIYETDEDRLPATIALNALAVHNGASIIRVHDVKAHSLAMAGVDFFKRWH